MGNSRTIICPFCREQRNIDKATTQDICPRCLHLIEYDLVNNLAWDRGPIPNATDKPDLHVVICPICHSAFTLVNGVRETTCQTCKSNFVVEYTATNDIATLCPMCKAPPKEGLKYDQGKLQWELFPAESAEQIIKVLMFGAAKYDPWNWSKGI
jgi:uncharacterized CHY-type Zn-finger protein